MPLSFMSQNYGNIAFGFFNIESDMLLLENYFFFADDFCLWIDKISKMAGSDDMKQKKIQHQAYYIADSNDIGDLMGAIHGGRFTGFIGKIYRLFPFPDDPKAFKQNPEGYQTRNIVVEQIKEFSEKRALLIEIKKNGQVRIGPYLFDKEVFNELIRYVWQGGYPRWKEEKRPDYVIQMKEKILKSQNLLLKEVFPSL